MEEGGREKERGGSSRKKGSQVTEQQWIAACGFVALPYHFGMSS